MKSMTWKQRMAVLAANKKRLVEAFPEASLLEESGIYAFTRYEEETGLKYAYVGQAKKVITRLAQHLMGHDQHIDLSLKEKARGLWSEKNPTGWRVTAWYFPETSLDEKEREFIKQYAARGYQLYNKTAGGQDKGKIGIAPNAPTKGYRDGLRQGYKNARRDAFKMFDGKLVVDILGKPIQRKIKAKEKFLDFINVEDKGDEERES